MIDSKASGTCLEGFTTYLDNVPDPDKSPERFCLKEANRSEALWQTPLTVCQGFSFSFTFPTFSFPHFFLFISFFFLFF